ncbi:MAG: LPXTG cell wall anchor domain-containing protein [Propionibacteriaceae bacterium]|jgi:LPXTG-motif cell wall-anchored protein|nr:LPXTG cell wall anchor domain-containing protein [Propionibacteriaceae bacterium]
MRRHGNRLARVGAVVVTAVVALLGTAGEAQADALPPGVLISDQAGLRVLKDGDYFIDARNLRPGEVKTTSLTIQNTEDHIPFQLFMTAEPMDSVGPVDLLNEVELRLELDGRDIYRGRIRGDENVDMVANSLNLGTYRTGDTKVMKITLTVNPDMKQSYTESRATIGWHFYAAKNQHSDAPKTGEQVGPPLLAISALLLIGTGVLLIVRRRRSESLPSEDGRP